MRLPRASGILLHPTSLPGRFGIGDLGPEAEAFADFLAQSGQRWWQMLPFGPTGYGNSPYQSLSSYAGNPLLISPEKLVEAGLLTGADLRDYPEFAADRVEFDAVAAAKDRLFRRAFERFDLKKHRGFQAFRRSADHWLRDYALFRALKTAHGERSWVDWGPAIARREASALRRWSKDLKSETDYAAFVQYLFHEQWNSLRDFCRRLGIGLIGDVPIFVAHDSADVWSRPDLFALDSHGRPALVAGVPPDYFCEEGQLWGNPLYRWPEHAADGYAWWAARLRATLDRVDLVRLDHFRGFEAYYEIDGGAANAVKGRWAPGPGAAFLEAMRKALGGLPLIAEDLGFITPEVHALRDQFDLPGMRILQFSFGGDIQQDRPFRFPTHCVVYTGTHDNQTTVGWFRDVPTARTAGARAVAAERAYVKAYLGTDGSEIHWDLVRLALASTADTTIIPMQDLMGLGDAARMNTPGRGEGNWSWRHRAKQRTPAIAKRLRKLAEVYGRCVTSAT